MSNQRRPLTENDIEQLSAYLDGVLADSERAALETRLNTEPDLRAELDELRQTVTLIKTLSPMQAPRNFTLTREMVGDVAPARADQHGRVPPRSRVLFFPTSTLFSAISAAAAILLFVVGAGLLFNSNAQFLLNDSTGNQVAFAPSEPVGRELRTDVGSLSGASPANAAEEAEQDVIEQSIPNENSPEQQSQQAPDDASVQAVAPPSADTTDRDESQARSHSATQMAFTATLDTFGYALLQTQSASSTATLTMPGTMASLESGADSAFILQEAATPFPTAFPTQVDGELGLLEGEGATGSGGVGAGGGGLPSQAGAAQTSLPQPETALSIAQAGTLTQTTTPTSSASATATETDTAIPAPSATAAPTLTPAPPPASVSSDGLGVILVIVAVALLVIAVLTTLARIRNR